jgi:hypothetical protein
MTRLRFSDESDALDYARLNHRPIMAEIGKNLVRVLPSGRHHQVKEKRNPGRTLFDHARFASIHEEIDR